MVNGYGMGITVTDRRWKPSDVANPIPVGEFGATQDIKVLDANLAAINAAYWTQKRLDQESIWDKVYYLRTQVGLGLA
jgi:hypothetical protein